jgi:hypothetical protein
MFRRLMLKVQPLANRYGDAAPAACCGVCKPCVTTAATGIVAAGVGAAVEAATRRRGEDEPAEA